MNDDAVLTDFYYNTAYNFADFPLSEPWEIYHFPLLLLSLHILQVLCKKLWMNATFTTFPAQRKGRTKILHEASLNLSTTPPQSRCSQHSQVPEILPDCSWGARTWRNASALKQRRLSGERSVLRFKGNQHPHTDMGILSHCKCFFWGRSKLSSCFCWNFLKDSETWYFYLTSTRRNNFVYFK